MTTDRKFASLLSPLYPTLQGAAMRLTRDPAAAEDLVQDTMVRAWRFRETFIEGSNVKAWALTILRNTFITSYHRKARAVQGLAELADTATPPAVVFELEQSLGGAAVMGSIMAAISDLPTEYRMAVTLADIDGLSYKEIADAMECPIGTVMSRIHRGRAALRKVLAGEAVEFGLLLAA